MVDPGGTADSSDGPLGQSPTYLVLGSLEVVQDCPAKFRLAPGRQEIVLAMLLLDANRVVNTHRLIDAVWDDDPPATARTQVQICVSALRSNLSKIGRAGALITKPPGYMLQVDDGHLDAATFAHLVAKAQSLAHHRYLADAAQALREGIALWRGPALNGIESRMLQARAVQLDESLLVAKETYYDLARKLGGDQQLIGEIAALVKEYPLRERLRKQLMLALYRSGRQAEALEQFRVCRELTIDQLGIEPSAELRELELAILSGDPRLRAPEPPVTVSAAATPELVAPLQLPADIADFTGRTETVAQIDELLLESDSPRATPVVVLAGKPGVGKSAMAVHAAHLFGETRFPDGQLYCELGGTFASPETPLDVLGRFLRALGIPGSSIPDTVDERAAMYRHVLARRRMLVVLDDAASESQVRALLPGSPTCAVIVTSRVRLTGLAGARSIEIDVFEPDEAMSMLVNVIGERRVTAEPDAAEALIRLVDGLPLALRIVSARILARPKLTLSWMLERLTDERHRLDELSHGEMALRASVALSYDYLPPDARRLLRLLSALDGLTFPSWVAATLLDMSPAPGSDVLECLVDMQMVEAAAADGNGRPRYKFHELIRLFASEQLDRQERPEDVEAAIGRVAAGWLGLAREAHSRLYGRDGSTVLHGGAPRWLPSDRDVDRILGDPMAWFELERANLVWCVDAAAQAGLDEHCWDLAVTLVALFEARCYFEDWDKTHQRALESVRAKGNARGRAALLCSLGSLHLSRRRPDDAHDTLMPALSLFTELGDTHGLAIVRRNLALVDQMNGEPQRALRRYEQAAAEFAAVGDTVGQAHLLSQVAKIALDAGDFDSAERHLCEAMTLCPRVGSRRVEVQVRFRLGDVRIGQRRYHQADELLVELLGIVRAGRDIVGEARILERLGTVNACLRNDDAAMRLLREALDLTELAMDVVAGANIRVELAGVLRALGRGPEAATMLSEAVSVYGERNMVEQAENALASAPPVPVTG